MSFSITPKTLLLAILCMFIFSKNLQAQQIVFTKNKKQVFITRYSYGVFYLKDKTSIKGYIDSLNEKEIFIKDKNGASSQISSANLAKYKCKWYMLYIGAKGHFFPRSKKYNLTDYQYAYVPRKERKGFKK